MFIIVSAHAICSRIFKEKENLRDRMTTVVFILAKDRLPTDDEREQK